MAGVPGGPVAQDFERNPELLRKRLMAVLAGMSDPGGMVSGVAGPEAAARIQADKEASPGGAMVGEMLNPLSMIPPIWEGAKGLYDAATGEAEQPPTLQSRDEFFNERRTKRPSLEEAVASAKSEFMSSPGYQQMIGQKMVTKADQALQNAGRDAERAWRAGQATSGDEEARLDADYQQYASGHDKRLEEFYGRDFADRHPGLSAGLQVAAPIAAAVLTRGAWKGVNARTDRIAKKLADQWDAGDVAAHAKTTMDADKWRTMAPVVKGGALAAAATIPLDARIAGTVNDAKQSREYQDSQGNWQRSRAQENAENDLKNPAWYAKEAATGAVSGLIGAGMGAKMAGSADELLSTLGKQPTAQAINTGADLKIAGIDANERVRQRLAQKLSAEPVPSPAAASNTIAPPAAPPARIEPVSEPVALPVRKRRNSRDGRTEDASSGVPVERPYDAQDNATSRNFLSETLDGSAQLPSRENFVQGLMQRLSRPISKKAIDKRAGGTLDELAKLQSLGVNVSDPSIRKILLDVAAPNKPGKLAVPLTAGAVAGGSIDEFPVEEEMSPARRKILMKLMGGT